MSDDELPPLPPDLASLFGEERLRPEPAADAAQARVLARLEASLPVAAGAAAPALAAKLGPIVLALAVGGAVGAGVMAKVQSPKVVYVDRAAPGPSPSPSSPASTEAIALPVMTRAERAAPATPSFAAPSASVALADTLARERAILDPARASLVKGDATSALAATERHARDYPRGQMSEEREVLAIQALVKLGRRGEATTRADEFKSHYPNSILNAVVDSVTDAPRDSK